MSITKAEIISIAFTRNVSEEHIKDADIVAAVRRFVLPYSGTVPSTPWPVALQRVVAFGVAWLIVDRMAVEVSDRGVVTMVSQGASNSGEEQRIRAKNSIMQTLIGAINDWQGKTAEPVIGYTGANRIGVL